MSTLTAAFESIAPRKPNAPAVILFSGGLDSTTILALAIDLGYAPYALSVGYGQRHSSELAAAKHCRPEYVESFERMANLATKAGVEAINNDNRFRIHAPIIGMSKSEIIELGATLGVDYSQTVSCYQANDLGEACGQCESCRLRQIGFKAAGVLDPTRYRK